MIEDVIGHGNDRCKLPGQIEAEAAELSRRHGGLLFTAAELDAFASIAAEAGVKWDPINFKKVEVP